MHISSYIVANPWLKWSILCRKSVTRFHKGAVDLLLQQQIRLRVHVFTHTWFCLYKQFPIETSVSEKRIYTLVNCFIWDLVWTVRLVRDKQFPAKGRQLQFYNMSAAFIVSRVGPGPLQSLLVVSVPVLDRAKTTLARSNSLKILLFLGFDQDHCNPCLLCLSLFGTEQEGHLLGLRLIVRRFFCPKITCRNSEKFRQFCSLCKQWFRKSLISYCKEYVSTALKQVNMVILNLKTC